MSGGGGRNPTVGFHGDEPNRDTHESKTDKNTLLFSKSKGAAAKLSYMGHLLKENRNSLAVNPQVTQATGKAEPGSAADIASALRGGASGNASRGQKPQHERFFGGDRRFANATPHVAQNTTNRSSAVDRRTVRHSAYAIRQVIRKRIEECFGWAKISGARQNAVDGSPVFVPVALHQLHTE